MTRRPLILLAAIAPVAAALAGPATQPAEYIVVGRPDGTKLVFGRAPKPGESPISDELDAVAGAAWRPVAASQPSTGPVVVVPPPATDPNLVTVTPGSGWAAAIRATAGKLGQTVRLAAGTHAGATLAGLTSLRLSGLTVQGAGVGKTIVRVPEGTAVELYAANGVVFRDISFVADRPTAPVVRFLAGCKGGGLVDCEVTGGTFGATVEGMSTRNNGVSVVGCHVHDNYHPTNGRSSGIYVDKTDGFLLSGCVFDTNGWQPGVGKGSGENHDAYLCGDNGPCVVTGNVFARAASHGLQMRAGGKVENNVFIDNSTHLSFGKMNGDGPLHLGGVSGTIAGNTFVGTKPSGPTWATMGCVEVGNFTDVAITDNDFAYDGPAYDRDTGLFSAAVKLDVCDLRATNPDRGKAVRPGKIVVAGNRGGWAMGEYWANPDLGAWDSSGCRRGWPAVDVAAVRRAAEARLAATASTQ